MPLAMTATPAIITRENGGETVSVDLFDANIVRHNAPASNLKDAQAAFETFVASLPTGTWSVTSRWDGPDKAPRGFKIACEDRKFRRTIEPAALAA